MALPDLTDLKVNETYQRLLQISSSGDIVDGTGSLFTPPNAISASYATSASYEINYETSSSYAETASYATSFSINGTSRTLFTSCSMIYSGSNVTQVTQSYEAGTTQITDILYSGSFADGNPLSIAVTGSDGINKLYNMEYSASVITQITVT